MKKEPEGLSYTYDKSQEPQAKQPGHDMEIKLASNDAVERRINLNILELAGVRLLERLDILLLDVRWSGWGIGHVTVERVLLYLVEGGT